MSYCRNLAFEEKPSYKYLKRLFTSIAMKEGIDLNDNMYDWAVKALAIKNYPNFYDVAKHNGINLFDRNGTFKKKRIKDRSSSGVEELIYEKAREYQF